MRKGVFVLLCALLLLGASALAGPAEDPFFPARQEGRWGYIDRTGQWRIPPVWDDASTFMEGGIALVKVAKGAGYRLIDKTGEALLELPDWEWGKAAGFVVDGTVVIQLVEIRPHDQKTLYFTDTHLLLPIEGESLGLPGEITGRITVDKWDDRLAVGFRLKEPIVPEYGDRSFVLLDCRGRRATEKIYHGDYFRGAQYALVHGMDETIGKPGNVYSGMLIDNRGNVVMENLPYGWVEGDLFLPRDDDAAAWTVDGKQLTGQEKAGHFAEKSPWGLYPYTEDGTTVYVDASGQVAAELGEWEDMTPDDDMGGAAWPFDDALGVAWVEKKDVNATKGRSFALINTKGQVLSEGWSGGQEDSVPPVFKDGLCVVGGSNYLRPDGTTLFPGRPFAFAEHFNQGLGDVTLMDGPSMLMAYVDEGGRLVWAENGETEALQARLDAMEKIVKLTAQEAARLLEGRWDLSAGGTIIGNPNTFYPDGTCDAGFDQPVRWEVRDYDEALGLFWNKPRFMLVFLDEAGEEVSSYGLTFSNPDEYSLTTHEGSGGYYRLKNESR